MNAFFRKFAEWTRDSTIASLVLIVIVPLISAYISMFAFTRTPLALLDRAVRNAVIANATHPMAQDTKIAIVLVDDETLIKQYHYRDPIDRDALAKLVSTIAARRPRAIGIDIVLDHATEVKKDDALRERLSDLEDPETMPIVVAEPQAETDEERGETESMIVGNVGRAIRDPVLDRFTQTVVKFRSSDRLPDGTTLPGFPVAIAESLKEPVPTDDVEIAWRGQPSDADNPFPEYSAQYVDKLPSEWFRNRIVLIGEDLRGIDRLRTPQSGFLPGLNDNTPDVVVQAHALSQLLDRRHPPSLPWEADFLVAFLLAVLGARDGAADLVLSVRTWEVVAAVVMLWIAGITLYYFSGGVSHGGFLVGLVAPTSAAFLAFFATNAVAGVTARREREFIRSAMSCYVSPEIVDQIVRNPSRLSLEGERREMTYLFTDIEDFTSLAEVVDSKELPQILNPYLERMTQIVMKHHGMVDKFIGDAVFAIFNAAVDLPNHADCAVRCALEMDDFAETFRKTGAAAKVQLGQTRIGIHSGPAVIGNFGSLARFSYTAQGDAVNTASRLESLNKHFGTRICASGVTAAQCRDSSFRPIAIVQVKGKKNAVAVRQPLHAGEYPEAYLLRYAEAFAHLRDGLADAMELVEALNRQFPGDPCVKFHLERLERGEQGVTLVITDK